MRPRCTQTAAFTGALLLVAACTFDPFGLGTEGETAPEMSTGGSSSTTTGEQLDPTTSGSSTSTGDDTTGPAESTTGPDCPGGCPPSAGWTVVGKAGEGVGYAVVVDANDDVVVAGDRMQASDPTLGNIWVGKFAGADGAPGWQMGRGGDAKREDFARAITIAGDGTILVAGAIHETDANKADVWLGWIDPASGDVLAESDLGTTDWNDGDAELDEWARALTIHPNGDLLVGGDRCKRPCETPEAWVGRYTATGEVAWDQPMLAFGPGAAHGLVAVGDGLVFVGTDGFVDSPSPWRSRIRQLTSTGGGAWSALPEDGQDDASYEARAVARAPDGLLWVVGRSFVTDADVGGFVRVYDPSSDVAPVAEVSDELGGTALALVLTGSGALVGGGTGTHLWFAELDPMLAELWRIEEVAVDGLYTARGLAIDGAGDIVVLGAFAAESRAEGERLWLRKYVASP